MTMALSIHGAPTATAFHNEETVWLELVCWLDRGRLTLFLRGPNAKEHAERIAEAINAAHRDEVGE